MRATVLVDNIANDTIKGEWGLSILIEYNDEKILLDVGASGLYVKNAEKLGLSLEDVDYAVLSHAHFDHANGMKQFFELNTKAKFYVQSTCAENCYFKKWIFTKYIGIPKRIVANYSDRIEYALDDYKLTAGAYLIGHSTKGLDAIGKREMMYRKEKTGWMPDDFSHEQSLVLDAEDGLIIFNSCSHGGVINTIHEVSSVFPGRKIKAYIGGFHIYNKSEAEVRELAGKIKETGIQYICTGHCTGEKAYEILKEELGDIMHQLRVGKVMEL